MTSDRLTQLHAARHEPAGQNNSPELSSALRQQVLVRKDAFHCQPLDPKERRCQKSHVDQVNFGDFMMALARTAAEGLVRKVAAR